jgi:hypothetical protein
MSEWRARDCAALGGAPGRLLLPGEIDGVLPLDDARLLYEANPVSPEGEVRAYPVE